MGTCRSDDLDAMIAEWEQCTDEELAALEASGTNAQQCMAAAVLADRRAKRANP